MNKGSGSSLPSDIMIPCLENRQIEARDLSLTEPTLHHKYPSVRLLILNLTRRDSQAYWRISTRDRLCTSRLKSINKAIFTFKIKCKYLFVWIKEIFYFNSFIIPWFVL